MQTYQGLMQKERVDLAGERGGQMCRLATKIIKDDARSAPQRSVKIKI